MPIRSHPRRRRDHRLAPRRRPRRGRLRTRRTDQEALPSAFIGTVTALDGRIATSMVSEVWAGEVAEVVTERGLVDGVGRPDGAATTEWRAELELLRLDDARIISAGTNGGAPVPIAILLVAVVVVLVAGASALAFRRQ